jgi:SAM-dependent methyltransferase
VLEIGCGQGAMGTRVAPMAERFEAIEPDGQSQAIAAGRLEPLGARVRRAFSYDLGDSENFDLICAFEVLEHIEDDGAALRDWARLLAPGCHLLLSVPAWQRLYGSSDLAVGHFRRYDPDDLAEVLGANGFRAVWLRLYGWPLDHLLDLVRDRIARRSGADRSGKAEGSARSGRWLQPGGRLAGAAITVGTAPFRVMQRWAPHRGTGLLALARRVE